MKEVNNRMEDPSIMATVLNCETIDSTYSSFEAILDLPKEKIDQTFDDFDFEKYCTENAYDGKSCGELVFNQFSMNYSDIYIPTEIYWFHGTRALPTIKFEDGIRPLNEIIDQIWDNLFSLASHTVSISQWHAFRSSLESDLPGEIANRYRARINNQDDCGPHGVLVKEFLLRAPELDVVDYLRSPETIEDICSVFQEKFGKDLFYLFNQASKPCIVSFRDSFHGEGALYRAIYYLYSKFKGYELDHNCNTCFSSNPTAIPRCQIVSIEYF